MGFHSGMSLEKIVNNNTIMSDGSYNSRRPSI
jgi:hypothetical protein